MTVLIYLVAITAANLIILQFGPVATIPVAFTLIGLDLVLRDKLHDAWRGNHLFLKMLALIVAGGGISYLINSGAAQIALASAIAFSGAMVVNALVYSMLIDRKWMIRSNGSNMPAAMVDSILFPTIAFGMFMPHIVLGQFAAKVLGGLFWSWIVKRWTRT